MLKKYSTAILFVGFLIFIGITAVSVALTRRTTSSETQAFNPDVLAQDVDLLHAPESGCVSKIGFTTSEAVDVDYIDIGSVKDVGKYPGLVQDKVRALMNCSFPSQNWSSSFSAPPSANPPIWAHIPEVAVSNPTYPYRPYQFIGAWIEDVGTGLWPVSAAERHDYRFLVFNEPIDSYDTNLLTPRAAALRFVQVGNRLAGADINSAPLPTAELEATYCCGNHNQPIDQKWMEQFLCHLSGQVSCPDYISGAAVTTPTQLVNGHGEFLRYLAGFHWHMYSGIATANIWSNKLDEIKGWIDGYHQQYVNQASLPQTVIITETGAPWEQWWGSDNVYDKINIVFQRSSEPWLEGVTWADAFINDDIFGYEAGISMQSSLFQCPDCYREGQNGHIGMTPAGYYFRECLHSNGVCPDPKTYVAPKEIDGLVGDLVVSGDFRVGATTVVTVPIDHFGDGTWFSSIKWRYLRPDGSPILPNTTCSNEYCEITPDATHLGQTIEILANVQQSDPDNSALKHICAKGNSNSGEWTIVDPSGGVRIGIPYNNPESECDNSLSAQYVVVPAVANPVCPTVHSSLARYLTGDADSWTVDPGEALSSFYNVQAPINPSTGQPVTGWSRISKKVGSDYQVVCSSAKVKTIRTQQTTEAQGGPISSQCVVPYAQGEYTLNLRIESVFPGIGENGSALVCSTPDFTVPRGN
ncbi:hypothetical protein KC921_01295 [Candidatus Woesebacteria bacterium]|nr:hypothetical protein [Candidatus Woesebacteria bacterium]